MTTSKICPHGQEFYCRFCGTISHIEYSEELTKAREEKRDYNNERGQFQGILKQKTPYPGNAFRYYVKDGD